MAIKNRSSVYDKTVDISRARIEHRATWMALTFDEANKAGADGEAISRAAIKRCGLFHGALDKANCADPEDMRAFEKVFIDDLIKSTFQMDVVNLTEDDMQIEFHYCPLLSAWQKLGFDDKTCETLCDIAMDGDRGIAEAMGFKFELGDTIAKGCDICQVHFSKK